MIPKPMFQGFVLSWVPIQYHERCINIYDSYGYELSATISMIMIHMKKERKIEEVLIKLEDFYKNEFVKQEMEIRVINPLNITFLNSLYELLNMNPNPPDYIHIGNSIPKELIPTNPSNN